MNQEDFYIELCELLKRIVQAQEKIADILARQEQTRRGQ